MASCYQQCLGIAGKHENSSIAFPAISTSAYGFPVRRAAMIAVGQVLDRLNKHEYPLRVVFCCFDAIDAAVYNDVIKSGDD